MTIQTSRFGLIEVGDGNQIQFPEGLLGFSNLRTFVLLDDPGDEIFVWLQSCEKSEVVFPVIESELLDPSYKFCLSKYDLEVLQTNSEEGCRCLTMVTIPEDPTQMTANMKAPIIIQVKEKLGKQCVLQDTNLAIRENVFSKLQQRVVQTPPLSTRNWTLNEGFTIRIPQVNKKSFPETGL